MKKIFLIITLLGTVTFTLKGQEVNKQLDDAKTAYTSGNLQESRFALQQALHEIDMAIGQEVLKILPQSLGDMQLKDDADNVSTAGFAGLFISRSYSAGEGKADSSVEIITDSPMLAGINALLAMPMFGSDPNQKRIRVGGYRALLNKSTGEAGDVSWNVQVPMGNTLLTFNCNGIDDERKVTEMVNSLKIDEIVKLVK